MHKSLIILSLCLTVSGCKNLDKIANPDAKSDFQVATERRMALEMPTDNPPAVEVATLVDVKPVATIAAVEACMPTYREWACIGGVKTEWAWGQPGFHTVP